jgi:hypothetical protein
MVEYKTTATSPHGLEEERQWARILSAGRPAAGMALAFIQKLCTAFHELGPAWKKGCKRSPLPTREGQGEGGDQQMDKKHTRSVPIARTQAHTLTPTLSLPGRGG